MSKNVDVKKIFNLDDDKKLMSHLIQYLKINVIKIELNKSDVLTAKETYDILKKYNIDNNLTHQIIDKRHKVKYFIFENKYIIPVKPSGCLYFIPIKYDYTEYLIDALTSFDLCYKYYNLTNKELKIKPLGIYYTSRDFDNYNVEAIIIDKYTYIPSNKKTMNKNDLINVAKKYKILDFVVEAQSIYDIIDKELIKGKDNIIIDDRIMNVNKNNYNNELYELFRLELSYYLKDNINIKNKIIKIIDDDRHLDYNNKKYLIKKILYKITSPTLYKLFIKNINPDDSNDNILNNFNGDNNILDENDKNKYDNNDYLDDDDLIPLNNDVEVLKVGKLNNKIDEDISLFDSEDIVEETKGKIININQKNINYEKYAEISNNRELCKINNDNNTCNKNLHCYWKNNQCKLQSSMKSLINIVNRITEEFLTNNLKSNEILMIDNYFVSDIINPNHFTTRDKQKIIKSNNNNINKIFSELFGENNIPLIGKRRINKKSKENNDIIDSFEIIGQKKYQKIYPNNVIYRAYTNAFYWIKIKNIDEQQKNLGYYSAFQTELSNYFKSQIIDWILVKKNQSILIDKFADVLSINKTNFIHDFKKYITKSNDIYKNYLIELFILFDVNKIPIIIYDNYDKIICIFDDNFIFIDNYIKMNDISKYEKYEHDDGFIRIKYNTDGFNIINIPTQIIVIY